MGQKKWLETEQSVSDILKLKPGLDFDQEGIFLYIGFNFQVSYFMV